MVGSCGVFGVDLVASVPDFVFRVVVSPGGVVALFSHSLPAHKEFSLLAQSLCQFHGCLVLSFSHPTFSGMRP